MKRLAFTLGIPVFVCLLLFCFVPVFGQQCPQGYTLVGGRCVAKQNLPGFVTIGGATANGSAFSSTGSGLLELKLGNNSGYGALRGLAWYSYDTSLLTEITTSVFGGNSSTIFGWTATAFGNGTLDTGISRSAAGVVAVGTGSNGSTAGTMKASQLYAVGQPATTGQRFACFTTTGQLVSSVSACSGT